MKGKIHPKYGPVTFTCSCGNIIDTCATMASTHIDICNKCHPFYTGKQKLIDSAGRVERFRKRYENISAAVTSSAAASAGSAPAAAAPPAVNTDNTSQPQAS